LTSDGPGRAVIRRLLPAAVVTLMVLGLARWQGERQGLYGTEAGVLLLTLAAILAVFRFGLGTLQTLALCAGAGILLRQAGLV